MDPKTIKVQLPLKGVHRALSRDSQPEGTCFDSLNVLPYDRLGRIRITQRPGLGTQIDLGTDAPVRFLHEVGLAGGASGGGWDVPFFDMNLSSLANADPDVDAETIFTDWDVGTTNFSVTGLGTLAQYFARFNGTRGTGFGAVTPFSTADLGGGDGSIQIPTNTAEASAMFSTVDITPADNFQMELFFGTPIKYTFISWRVDAANPTNTADVITLRYDATTQAITVYQGTTLIDTLAATGYTSGVLGIRVEGDDVTLLDDGVEFATTTVTGQVTTQRGVAVGASDDGGAGDNLLWGSLQVFTEGPASISRARSKLIAISDTKTFMGSKPSTVTEVVNDGSYPIDASSLFVDGATLFGFEYIVDGTNIYKLDLETQEYVAFTETEGTFPDGCTIAVAYRGRLVLSGTDTDSQNIFASRVGDPTDWDYAAEDPAAAWAANSAPSGRVGQPIMALMPLSDDIMLIGCEQSIWRIEGDPGDQGAIHPVSNAAGISGPKAWCVGEDGRVYFVGPSGFYRANPDGGDPVNIARDVYPQYFFDINRFTTHITLMYDQERHGVWIYLAPESQASAPAISLFYDVRLEGFWPMQFTNLPQAGPLSAVQWDAVGSDARYPLLGGYDGVLYWQSRNRRSDVDIDSVSHAVESYVVLGPLSPFDPDNAIITKLDVTGGDQLTSETTDFFNMDWEVRGGRTAFSVTEGTPVNVSVGNVPEASQRFVHVPRTRGSWITLKLSNETVNNYMTIESLFVYALYGGKQR